MTMRQLLPVLAAWCACTLTISSASAATPPNIVFVLCDDLGFGDTGPTFQNERAARKDRSVPAFATPQLDRMAAEGLQLRNHYTAAPVCAPSRASLMVGQTQGHANIRDNQFDKALANTHTVASVLKAAGYATAAFGKWGLQGRADGKANVAGEAGTETAGGNAGKWPAYPTRRGFDFYYGYVRHKDGHFHYPKEDGREVWENDREVSAGLDLCYTTDLFTARAKKWIVEHHAAQPKQPFFIYLSFDTPHAKLQLPPSAYPAGGGLKGGLQWTGKPGAMINAATGTMDGWMDPALAKETWDHDRNPATPEVPWPDVQKRYVAGVQRIDAAVGDLTQLLKDLGLDDNTLIVFTSDNGPSKESYLKEAYDPTFFAGYGDFSGIKRDTLEGGIREPALVRWPSRIPAGRIDRTPTGMWDWLATFADAAGIPAPATSDGVSLMPVLTGKGQRTGGVVYVEYFNETKSPNYADFPEANRRRDRQQMQSILLDGYMGVRYRIASADDNFEIYDVEKDPGQANDLGKSPALSALQAKMKARVLQLRRPDASAKRPYDAALIPAVDLPAGAKVGQLSAQVYKGEWSWIPDFRTLKSARQVNLDAAESWSKVATARSGVAVTGWFYAQKEGTYTFQLASDRGATLFLHEARVVDGDRDGATGEMSGTVNLAAGWHPVRIYSRHRGERPSLAVTAIGPEGVRIPLSGQSIARAGQP